MANGRNIQLKKLKNAERTFLKFSSRIDMATTFERCEAGTSLKIEFGPGAVLFGARPFLYCQGTVRYNAYPRTANPSVYLCNRKSNLFLPICTSRFSTAAKRKRARPYRADSFLVRVTGFEPAA